MLTSRVFCVPLAVLILSHDQLAYGQPKPGEQNSSVNTIGDQTANSVLESLRKRHEIGGDVWVEQSQLDPLIREGGGGACPSAAALIAFQAIRAFAGLEAVPNPHRVVLGAFANDRTLLEGRLTNSQFVDLLMYYERLLEGAKIQVDVMSAPNSPHAADSEMWPDDQIPDLTSGANGLKILSYTCTKESGEVLGRHFVVLKSYQGGEVSVIDPQSPTKVRRYTIERDLARANRIFLRFPPQVAPQKMTLELNTIFTVTVRPIAASGRFTPTESSPLIRLQREIDMLAETLTARDDLRSPRKWRSQGSHFGLTALDLPAEYGGANWPAVKMIEVFKHAGRYDLNLRDVVGAAHARVLLQSETPEVRDIVQKVADGDAYVAIAITEPDAGSDFTAMESACEKVEGGYRLNGIKRFNARLDQASHVIVFTRGSARKKRRLNCFVLPIDAEGLIIERFGAHGLTGNSYGGLKMKNVFVPETHRIGQEGEGYHIFNNHFRYWRLMQTAAALGTAERALEMMAARLETRKVYGKPIGRFTHLQQPLGQYSTELKMAHALAIRAGEMLDCGAYEEADALICGLKAEGVEIALEAVDAAARAFGGEGYSDLVDLGDRLRDLNGLRIADGPTDVMRSAVVSKVYGSHFWEMAIKPKEDSTSVDPGQ